jgi:hypothetical protein
VRPDQGQLQFGGPRRRDHGVGERPEPRRDAIYRLGLIDEAIDDRGSPLERVPGVVTERDEPVATGYGDDVGGAHAVGSEHQLRIVHGSDGSATADA